MKSYKINEKLYLNEYSLPEMVIEQKTAGHQYIILDRSGSMWYELDNVIDIITEYVDTLEEGTEVSLGYFSGYDEYGLSVPYTLKKEKDGVIKTLNSYRHALGMTNYIQILEKIKNDSKDRESSLFFFTDGCHNCGSFNKVLDVLKELNLSISVFVGCGHIDRDNMNDMASVTEGSFIQLSSFSEFKKSLYDFNETAKELGDTYEVTIPYEAENICSVLGKNVIKYTLKEGKIKYKASNRNSQICYFTSENPCFNVVDISKNEVGIRTLVYTLVQNNQVPKALEVLGKLGDKYFIRRLYNTFTLEEYAKIEDELLSAIFTSKKRYREGKVSNYLVDDNSLCVLDVLDVLTNDDKLKIHLSDKEFEYNRTSRKTEQQDGSKITMPNDIQASSSCLVYHGTRLNVNLQTYYGASVKLDPNNFAGNEKVNLSEEMSKFGLKKDEMYPITCIRNYSIITDAHLNTPKLVLSKVSKDTLTKLGEYLNLREDNKYTLDLSTLPLINKGYLKETSATKLAQLAWNVYVGGIKLSVLKYLKKIKQVETTETDVDKKQFLLENFYIKDGMYTPPVLQAECTDEYNCYEFDIKFKGYSKPTASTVIKKLNENKKVSAREKLVEIYYEEFKGLTESELDTVIKAESIQNKNKQTQLQHKKFAIILINRGCMDEFKSRNEMNITLNVENYNLLDKEVVAEFSIVQKPVKI